MAERPLLLFPEPENADRTKRPAPPPKIHYPTHTRQGERLSPLFRSLQTAFESRNVEIQQSTAGLDPEQVLVIETIGSVDKFINAVKHIDGLEWLGEIEVDEIIPDEDFYVETDTEKALNGRFYLLMSNQRAMNELLSLWQQYCDTPELVFQRGLAKFKNVFKCLKDIRRWGIQERLIETGVIENWNESLQIDVHRAVRFEIELWYRNSIHKRNEIQATIETLIHNLGGQIVCSTSFEGIEYHAILGELPANEIQNIILHPNGELVKCDGIMFFRPTGQFSNISMSEEGETGFLEVTNPQFPSGDPIIALLDGMPLVNHTLLSDRLIIDDPDNYNESYRALEREHGTAMASLIIHGDLNNSVNPIKTPIYFRPILKPNPLDFGRKRVEEIPNDILAIDLIHRTVRRIFEGENGEEAVAPSIKTVNLSIGDRSRLFDRTMSPLGRLLDWLSFKYNVLFIVSSGNHTDDIVLPITNDEFNALSQNELQEIIVKSIFQNARNKRLLSPAESINSLTIGALHFDFSTVTALPEIINPYSNNNLLPSPFSAFGSGYRRAIKPDLVFYGGKQLYRKTILNSNSIKLSQINYISSPGNKVASTDDTGQLNKTKFSRGTSNATALISRSSAICFDSLRDIFDAQLLDFENNPYITVLLKTMLVHGCSWGETGERIQEILRIDNNARQIKSWISRWIGNGIPNFDKVLDCTFQRATVLGYGELLDEGAHIYYLPLPPSLSSQRTWRRLTITLTWLTPIFPRNQKYRAASLWFEANNNIIGVDREDADYHAVRRGTVQHEVFEGAAATPYVDGDNLVIKINCRADANKFNDSIRYGLAVSLEVSESIDIAIYEEIKARIATIIQIQQHI